MQEINGSTFIFRLHDLFSQLSPLTRAQLKCERSLSTDGRQNLRLLNEFPHGFTFLVSARRPGPPTPLWMSPSQKKTDGLFYPDQNDHGVITVLALRAFKSGLKTTKTNPRVLQH